MMSNMLLPLAVIGGWATLLVLAVAVSIALQANVVTTALLLVLGIAPAIAAVVLAESAPSPSVAQILHSLDTKDGRS